MNHRLSLFALPRRRLTVARAQSSAASKFSDRVPPSFNFNFTLPSGPGRFPNFPAPVVRRTDAAARPSRDADHSAFNAELTRDGVSLSPGGATRIAGAAFALSTSHSLAHFVAEAGRRA
jgi:hypothetical protein